MRTIVSVSLDESLKDEVDRLCRQSELSRSEIIKRALRHYLYAQRLKAMRSHLRPYAEKAGFYTDEDVFSVVS